MALEDKVYTLFVIVYYVIPLFKKDISIQILIINLVSTTNRTLLLYCSNTINIYTLIYVISKKKKTKPFSITRRRLSLTTRPYVRTRLSGNARADTTCRVILVNRTDRLELRRIRKNLFGTKLLALNARHLVTRRPTRRKRDTRLSRDFTGGRLWFVFPAGR